MLTPNDKAQGSAACGDPELILYWKTFPASSNEMLAAELLEAAEERVRRLEEIAEQYRLAADLTAERIRQLERENSELREALKEALDRWDDWMSGVNRNWTTDGKRIAELRKFTESKGKT